MRLIDADALKDECERIHDEYPREHQGIEMLLAIDKSKQIDYVPEKRGHWYIRGNYIECSECKQGKVVADLPVPDYCEQCGSKNL